jgi:chaperonin GroES
MEIGGLKEVIPLEDRVLIRPQEAEEITSSGIIIPDSATEGAVRGTVVAVGPGKYSENGTLIPLTVKVGDEVLYGTKYFGTECIFDGETFILVPHGNLFAILKRKEEE